MNTLTKIISIIAVIAICILSFWQAVEFYGDKLTYGDNEFIERAAVSSNINDRVYAATLLIDDKDSERRFNILKLNHKVEKDHKINKLLLAIECVKKVDDFCKEFLSSSQLSKETNSFFKVIRVKALINSDYFEEAIDLLVSIKASDHYDGLYGELFEFSAESIERNKPIIYRFISKVIDDKYLKSFLPAGAVSVSPRIGACHYSNERYKIPEQLQYSSRWQSACLQLGKLLESNGESLIDVSIGKSIQKKYHFKHGSQTRAAELDKELKALSGSRTSLSSRFSDIQMRNILGFIKFYSLEQDDYFEDLVNQGEVQAMKNYITKYED